MIDWLIDTGSISLSVSPDAMVTAAAVDVWTDVFGRIKRVVGSVGVGAVYHARRRQIRRAVSRLFAAWTSS